MVHNTTLDVLTGLPNRIQLLSELQDLLNESREGVAALLYIDLHSFNVVNDTLGYQVGDQALKQVASRISSVVQKKAMVCRLGGDAFAVLTYISLTGCSERELLEHYNIALMTKEILISLMLPFKVEHHRVSLGGSIGVSIISSHDRDANEKLRQADMALHVAKQQGPNEFRFYTPELDLQISTLHDVQIKLKDAIKNNELAVYFQPQLNSKGEVIGAEALLRWFHKELGCVSPNVFIPIAEQSGQIVKISHWMMDTAFQALQKWLAKMSQQTQFRLAVNVSPQQFDQRDFTPMLRRILARYQLEPEWIQLEITERLLLSSFADTEKKLHALRALGFSIAIDDFGTGFSSLSYLTQLPIDKIKIDKSFIARIHDDHKSVAVVEAILSMSEKLGINVIAEGVETHAQRAFLVERGCFEFQGFLFAKPMDYAAIEAYMFQAHKTA